jgi:gliding motility-associated lipoprotein GldH
VQRKATGLRLWLAMSFLLAACTHTFKEYKKDVFPGYRWNPDQQVSFQLTVADTSIPYSIAVGVRHVYGLPYEALPLIIDVIGPDQQTRRLEHTLILRKANGDPVASCAGDLCDLELQLEDQFRFEHPGDYRINLSLNQTEPMLGFLEVGIIVNKAD